MMGRFDLVRRLKYYTAKWGRRDSFTFRMFKIFFVLFFSVSLVFTLYFVEIPDRKGAAGPRLERIGRSPHSLQTVFESVYSSKTGTAQ